jgi:hypothetical protein
VRDYERWIRRIRKEMVMTHMKVWSWRLYEGLRRAIKASTRYTGHFIIFSVITNIYRKKTKGPTLMELFTATGKLKKFFFLTTRDVRCMHHGWHGTHRYDIQITATHASTCWHVHGKNFNIISMCAVSPVVHTLNISSCFIYIYKSGCEQFH